MNEGPSLADRTRLGLFMATGLAVPFYAFPLVHLMGKPVDLASLIGIAFLAVSLPAVLARRPPRWAVALIAAGAAIPLLAVVPPRVESFSLRPFFFSYAHWLFVLLFFIGATLLEVPEQGRRFLVRANVVVAAAVAAFGVYQFIGLPRNWTGTGQRLLAIQREDFRFMPLGGYMRPTSVFLEPAWLGGYLAWVLALALSIAVIQPRGRRRLAWLAAAALLALPLALTVSFGAYADACALFAVFVFVVIRGKLLSRRDVARAAVVVCLAVLLAALSPPGRSLGAALQHRFRNLHSRPSALWKTNPEVHESFWMRVRNVEWTYEVFVSRPLRGIGIGEIPGYLQRKSVDPNAPLDLPCCGWLAIAAEMGLLGPLFLAGVLLVVWRRARSNSQDAFARIAVPVLLAIAATQQLHTASFIDLWWWYPVSVAGLFAGPRLPSIDPPGDLRYRS